MEIKARKSSQFPLLIKYTQCGTTQVVTHPNDIQSNKTFIVLKTNVGLKTKHEIPKGFLTDD